MRQNAPQKRGRGRPSGRRGYTNALNRTYDSNGPDVKVRGTAMTVYEKYQALARDASASGDRVGAENYLQHAEHYYRLMQTAKQQMQANQPAGNGQDRDANRRQDNDNRGNGQADGDTTPAPQRDARGEAPQKIEIADEAPGGSDNGSGSEAKPMSPAALAAEVAAMEEAGGNGAGDADAGPQGEAREPRRRQPRSRRKPAAAAQSEGDAQDGAEAADPDDETSQPLA